MYDYRTKLVRFSEMVKLTEKEIRLLEAALTHSAYKEAAESIGMDYKVYCTYLARLRKKVNEAKKFMSRMKRYNSVLYKHYGREEEAE